MNTHSLHSETQAFSTPDLPPEQRQQAGEIRRLRETLFELQCELEPDTSAIDGVMRRLAVVRQSALLN